MTTAEDKEKGVLTVDLNYIEIAQSLNNVIHMCQKLKDRLDIAAIKRKAEDRDGKETNQPQ